jgi:rhamnose utilization protein RhaD (predicted bifunctional aldolase and dehydrogenase)
VLGGHGLFTWGETQRECYVNTLTVIDQLGQFIERHSLEKGPSRFGGLLINSRPNRKALAVEILPFLRGRISSQRRWIANFSDSEDVLQFVNSRHAKDLSFLGTSCPDHFIRTKIRPMFVPWAEVDNVDALKEQIDESLAEYRAQYRSYYEAYALPGSVARYQSLHCVGPRARHVQLWQEQNGSAYRRRVLYQCDSRDGRR